MTWQTLGLEVLVTLASDPFLECIHCRPCGGKRMCVLGKALPRFADVLSPCVRARACLCVCVCVCVSAHHHSMCDHASFSVCVGVSVAVFRSW